MTFEKLAKMIADDFAEYIKEYDYESFREMMRIEDMDWRDIREEISYSITKIANDAYDRGDENSMFYMYDDGTYVYINGLNEMPWREFKNLFIGYLKEYGVY